MGPGGEETDSDGNSIYDSRRCLGWKDADDGEFPPNYHVSIYDAYNGQPFVQVGGKGYGAHKGGEVVGGETIEEYGEDETDAVMGRPSLLEIHLRFTERLFGEGIVPGRGQDRRRADPRGLCEQQQQRLHLDRSVLRLLVLVVPGGGALSIWGYSWTVPPHYL